MRDFSARGASRWIRGWAEHRYRLFLGVLTLLAVAGISAYVVGTRGPNPVMHSAGQIGESGGENQELLDLGRQLFQEKGCTACHGPNAEGTANGPALAGFGAETVKAQVRQPLGNMPPFPQPLVSDAELDAIASYVASLGEAMHMEPGADLSRLPQPISNWRELGLPGDPDRGRQLLVTGQLPCMQCHSLRGVGGADAPGLGFMTGRVTIQDLVGMAAVFWDHFPHMDEAFHEEGVEWPRISKEQ